MAWLSQEKGTWGCQASYALVQTARGQSEQAESILNVQWPSVQTGYRLSAVKPS